MDEDQFKQFLYEDAGLDDDTVQRLLDSGFDDLESLALAEKNTL